MEHHSIPILSSNLLYNTKDLQVHCRDYGNSSLHQQSYLLGDSQVTDYAWKEICRIVKYQEAEWRQEDTT